MTRLVLCVCLLSTLLAVPVHAQQPSDTDLAARYPPLLNVHQARQYMVDLVNRDRATQGLPRVVLDEGIPTTSGQRQAIDMASHGFVGHWGTDGSLPYQRYTEAGGGDFVAESSSCHKDWQPREIDPAPAIKPKDIASRESSFFNEKAPNDGHRQNILNTWHRRVGIGMAQPAALPHEIIGPCLTQEFVDSYGTFGSLPREAGRGDRITVTGTIDAPALIAYVELGRLDLSPPLEPREISRRWSYPNPTGFRVYWPRPFVSPIPVDVDGQRFSVAVPLTDHGKPGLYAVTIWARMRGSNDPFIVSLRTIVVK